MTGAVDQPASGVRRVLAPNPSAMCAEGTNTYILGEGAVVVIDPGPAIPRHVDTVLAALSPGEVVVAICVTHSHLDHSAAAPTLAQRTGAPVCAFGGPGAGRSAVMADLAQRGLSEGGEGLDHNFRPDRILRDGDAVDFGAERLGALWTPGHCSNHLSFLWRGIGFSGDHVMGWASSLISPPDGDLTAYMDSLTLLEAAAPGVLLPGHGAPVADPAARIAALRHHRQARGASILAALHSGIDTVPALTRHIYTETPAALRPAAERNVFAHLIDLCRKNQAQALGDLAFAARFVPGLGGRNSDK
ncbi:MBL fold metallo-hydrolase [Roseicitreum antarcticum]|uniref:MBL fold metallo-hydrolase n=1 Tax=Roseicitreum antarcticum TaxID=564137 RepID=UPI001CC200C7|nr:MBL fold metallo-hydrolase [Roseicitreum antarcticum]